MRHVNFRRSHSTWNQFRKRIHHPLSFYDDNAGGEKVVDLLPESTTIRKTTHARVVTADHVIAIAAPHTALTF